MRRILFLCGCLVGLGLPTCGLGQTWRVGVVLEGQVFPFGLAGFIEMQHSTLGFHGQIGWDLFGGLYVSGEPFYQPGRYARMALGMVIYPGVAQAAPDLNFEGVMLFPHVGARREDTGWGHLGLGLPLQGAFYRELKGDWAFLGLLRARLQIVRR